MPITWLAKVSRRCCFICKTSLERHLHQLTQWLPELAARQSAAAWMVQGIGGARRSMRLIVCVCRPYFLMEGTPACCLLDWAGPQLWTAEQTLKRPPPSPIDVMFETGFSTIHNLHISCQLGQALVLHSPWGLLQFEATRIKTYSSIPKFLMQLARHYPNQAHLWTNKFYLSSQVRAYSEKGYETSHFDF